MSSPAGDAPVLALQARLIALLRVACATTLMVLSFSMLQPVLAVRLQTSGVSASAIGVLAMLPFLTVALMVPQLTQPDHHRPRLAESDGGRCWF